MSKITKWIYPTTIDEALILLSENDTEIIAGGTHIATQKHKSPIKMVDITRIPLNYIKKEKNSLRIGSTTTITEIIESPLCLEVGKGILTKACQLIADTPLRNKITLGGNIARKIPWVGLPVVLLVLDAEIMVIEKGKEEKRISARNFFEMKKLQRGKLIKEVIFPINSALFTRYEKFCLTKADYAWLTLAFSSNIELGIIKDVKFAVSRITNIQRITSVEEALIGKKVNTIDTQQLINLLRANLSIVADFRSSKEYRTTILEVFLKRFINEMKEETT
ncbi:FAD binding domain-containing protein [Candidatus Hodarchaeum mangrovi]